MGIDEDFQQIQTIPRDELASWIGARFLGAAPAQWWGSIFDSIESSVSRFRDISAGQRRDAFELGAQLIVLSGELGGVPKALVAYWNLRLAALALRFDPPIDGLVQQVTPDGAARMAIDSMPTSQEEAVRYAVERSAEYEVAGDDFYAPVGVAPQQWPAPGPRNRMLQDIERTLSALQWVEGSLLDDQLRAEVVAWLNIRHVL